MEVISLEYQSESEHNDGVQSMNKFFARVKVRLIHMILVLVVGTGIVQLVIPAKGCNA